MALQMLDGSWALRVEGAVMFRFDVVSDGNDWSGSWVRPASFVEVVGIDCGDGLALFGEGFGAGAAQLEFSGVEHARCDQLAVKAHELQLDGVIGLGAFQRNRAARDTFLEVAPESEIGYGKAGFDLAFCRSLGFNCWIRQDDEKQTQDGGNKYSRHYRQG